MPLPADPAPRVTARALHIPADPVEPCALLALALSGVALSDALGGGLPDDVLCATVEGQGYVVYLDLDRVSLDLPPNLRAMALVDRLGAGKAAEQIAIWGDALFLGADELGDDTHVPLSVLTVARRIGLLPIGTSGGRARPFTMTLHSPRAPWGMPQPSGGRGRERPGE